MGWRESADRVGHDPARYHAVRDLKEAPECIVVNVVKPEMCDDGEYHDCRTYREFPLFMARAAVRWRAYWERKHGKGNAWEEFH